MEPVKISDEVFTAPDPHLDGDGLRVWGSCGKVELHRCVFDFRKVPSEQQDEAVDCIKGARVYFDGCVFLGCKKAVLCGNGDYPEEDKKGFVHFEKCAFIRCGRRCPEVQDGVMAMMHCCWIHDWGVDSFDVRTFGARVSAGAILYVMDCLFSRAHGIGFKNTVIDIANQIGEHVNEHGVLHALFHPWQALKPGPLRCVDIGRGGKTRVAYWSNVLGNRHEYSGGKPDVLGVIQSIREACPDMTPYLGMPIDEYFVREVGRPWAK